MRSDANGSHRLLALIAARSSSAAPLKANASLFYRGEKTHFYRSFIVTEHNNHAAHASPSREGGRRAIKTLCDAGEINKH